MRRRFQLPVVLALLLSPVVPVLHAQFNWTGWGFESDYFNGANWQGGLAPPNNGSADIVFGNTSQSFVFYNTSLEVNSVAFNGIVRPFFIQGPIGTLNLGAGGLTYAPTGQILSTIHDTVALTANQTWNISSGTLRFDGSIRDGDGTYDINKTGAGTLEFARTDAGYDWSGGLTLSGGRTVVYSDFYSYNFYHAD